MNKLVVGMGVCVVVVSVVGSSLAKDRAEGDKKQDGGAMFEKKDKNGDGKLSLDEFVGKKAGEDAEKLKEVFKKKDKDGDGFLTKDDMARKGGKAKGEGKGKKKGNE